MLDIGGWEFLIVAFVLIMVVGPKELPKMLRGFTRIIHQVRSMATEFSRSVQDIADEPELGDIRGAIDDVKRGNLSGIADAIDPDGDLKGSVENLKASARKTGLSEDLSEIKDLAGATGDNIVEKVNQPSQADISPSEVAGANKKSGS